jgi:phospholipase/carboxylesterase
MTDLGFNHRYVPATRPGLPPLLLLHGTGGDENDLLPLGPRLLPGAALLSPRGKVLENGMPRFFRRMAEGVFDVEDIKARAAELAQFIRATGKAYGIAQPVAVGFSNGANIAAALLLLDPDMLRGAVLIRAMLPFEPKPPPTLKNKPILMLSGARDPIMPSAAVERLAAVLTATDAAFTRKVLPAGHNLTPEDISIAATWLESIHG